MTLVVISANSFSVLILFIAVFSLSNATSFNIVKAESSASCSDFCVYSGIDISLPKISEAEPRILEISSTVDWCTNDSKSKASDKVLLLLPGSNCSHITQLQNFYCMGGRVSLISFDILLDEKIFLNGECQNWTEISLLAISKGSANALKEMGENITVKVFQPPDYQGFYVKAILAAIAIFTATIGSYMSGLTSYKIFSEQLTKECPADVEEPEVHRNNVQPQDRRLRKQNCFIQFFNKIEIGEENRTPVFVLNPSSVVLMTMMMVFAIVTGYFLKEYLLTFLLVAYTFFSIFCLYFCLYSWTSEYGSYFFKK